MPWPGLQSGRSRLDRRVAQPRAAAGQNPWPVVALGLAGLAFVLWRPLHVAIAYAHRAAAFPAIADFSSARGLDFVTTDGVGAAIAEIPAPWAHGPGERALEIRYDPQHPPAVQVVEPQGDWRAYSVIAVDLTNAGPGELSLVLRILDATHDWSHEDRFNLPLVIPAADTDDGAGRASRRSRPRRRPGAWTWPGSPTSCSSDGRPPRPARSTCRASGSSDRATVRV